MPQPDLQTLIYQCKQRNESAFRELVDMYRDMVYTFTFRMLCNEEDARDAVQETFIRVWTRMDTYKPESKFTTWLFAIASHYCCDRIRRRKCRNVTANLDSVQFAVVAENMDEAVTNSDLARLIHRLTDKLTPKQKLVFTLRDLEGMETDEVIKITGMTAGKVKSNLYLARQYIRAELEKTEQL